MYTASASTIAHCPLLRCINTIKTPFLPVNLLFQSISFMENPVYGLKRPNVIINAQNT